jgi:ArsR family transcriptional regulator, arsenate/arsenite/antimonite-responsive transcriptional repressor
MRKLAELFKALADENRLKIIKMLSEKELCVCEIYDKLNMSQPAISHHLKILRVAGLVKDTKEGKWIYYSLDKDALASLAKEYQELFNLTTATIELERTDCSVCEQLEKQQKPPLKEVK